MREASARSIVKGLVIQASVVPLVLLGALAAVLALELADLRRLDAWVDHTDVVIGRVNWVGSLALDR